MVLDRNSIILNKVLSDFKVQRMIKDFADTFCGLSSTDREETEEDLETLARFIVNATLRETEK